MTDELLIDANQLWQRAEDSVADDPVALQRVKVSWLSVDYALLTRARIYALAKQSASRPFTDLAIARFQPFFDVLKTSKVERFTENQELDKEAYRRDLAKDLGIQQ